MLITQEHRQLIEERFAKVRLTADTAERLTALLPTCTEDEQICMKYLYAFMPDQDITSYNEELFLQFVRQALETKKVAPWGEKIEGPLFLNYVLQYRINNENIEFYKEEFFNEIFPRIKALSMYEAAIEVNYWCFEKATYQSTNIRTASPFTVLKNAYGRCGEESTLATAALRSVGIPARQVYAPRWVHCDDNHAWTEVWIDGEWHFLGACEPEPVLDTGWFMLPASKGMLIHSKVFSTLVEDESIVMQTEKDTEINRLAHYADTKEVTVTVKNTGGQVVEGAKVRFEIINYSELFPIAELLTDANGQAKFITGYGDLVICAHKEGIHVQGQLDVRLQSELELTLPDSYVKEEATVHLTLVPPVGCAPAENNLTEEQKKTHEEKNAKALAIRERFKETFYIGEKAAAWAKDYVPYEKGVQEYLEKSLGNYQEIINFIQDEETKDLLEYKVKLLGTLMKKDCTDITCAILKEHLLEAMKCQKDYADDIFVPYILCPRASNEMIVPYRTAILSKLDEATKASYLADPKKIYDFSMNEVEAGQESRYSDLYASPVGMLDFKRGNAISRRVLFVVLCRTLGIPARLNRQDDSVSYYQDGRWVTLASCNTNEVTETSTLVLKKETADLDFDYFKTYTIGKFDGEIYTTLGLEERKWEEEAQSIQVESGRYRVVTSNRQADGTLLTRLYYVEIAEGETAELVIGLTQEEKAGHNVEIPESEVSSLEGVRHNLSDLVDAEGTIVAYLDIAAEPTEHILNEILESKEKFNSLKPSTILIIGKEEDRNDLKLQKVLQEVPHIKVYVGFDKAELESIYTGFNIEDRKLPLVYIMHEPMKAQYAWAGYNVGMGEMLLKYIQVK